MSFSLPLFYWPSLFLRRSGTEAPPLAGTPDAALHSDIGLPPRETVPANARAMAAVLSGQGYSL